AANRVAKRPLQDALPTGSLRCPNPMATSQSGSRSRQRAAAAPVARAKKPARPAPSGPTIIEFRGVSKHYPGGDVGLDQATFSISREEFVFLVGSTGSGKSTVMRLLIKELEPTEGTIRVAGHNLNEIKRSRVPFYR